MNTASPIVLTDCELVNETDGITHRMIALMSARDVAIVQQLAARLQGRPDLSRSIENRREGREVSRA